MNLNTRNYYLCNSFGQQEESNLLVGIPFEDYVLMFSILLKENQIECATHR